MEMRRLLLDEVAAIIAGTLSGAKYGLKIRLPHATVMTFLFAKQLTFREKSKTIAKLTAEHATNLAAFVFIYKVSVTRDTEQIRKQRSNLPASPVYVGGS